MAQLKAVYASTINEDAQWFAGAKPVIIGEPYVNWPDLRNLIFSPPIPSYVEEPQYLWNLPKADPNQFAPESFVRTFWGKDNCNFDAVHIPTGSYLMVITHAADDLYTLNIYVNDQLVPPSPVQNDPSDLSWRNVKSFVFEFTVENGYTLQIQSIVTNLWPGVYNPAMFTWVAQFYTNISV